MRTRAIAILGASILIAAALVFYGYTHGNIGRPAPLPPAPETQTSQIPPVETQPIAPAATPASPIGDAPELPAETSLGVAPDAPQFPPPDGPSAGPNAKAPSPLPDAPATSAAAKLPPAPGQPLFPSAQASTGVTLRLKAPLPNLKPGRILDTFNSARSGGRRHEATDILAPKGTPIYAVASGQVKKLFLSKPGGITVYQFDPSEQYCYYYAHLDRYAEGLHEGQPVHPGDILGYVGTTGDAAPDTPHLHFAIFKLGPEKNWWQGTPLNPYPFLLAAVR